MTVIGNNFEPEWILIQSMISNLEINKNYFDGNMMNCNGFDVKCDSVYMLEEKYFYRDTHYSSNKWALAIPVGTLKRLNL